MLAVVLFSPFARAASRAFAWWLARLLSWAILVVFGLLGVATPAGAQDAAPALDPALLESVRALALGTRVSEPGAP